MLGLVAISIILIFFDIFLWLRGFEENWVFIGLVFPSDFVLKIVCTEEYEKWEPGCVSNFLKLFTFGKIRSCLLGEMSCC